MARRSAGILSVAATVLSLSIAIIPARDTVAASLLVETGTGTVIFADDANHLWYPASLTKMMTVYAALEKIKAGRLSFDDQIIVSKKAANVSPVRFGLREGQRITVRQAINAAIVASSNDAAVALAEKISGSEENFADMMTLAARGLGMTRTIFRNATGLPDARQVTTAHDMALLAMALLREHQADYSLFNQRSVTIAGKSRPTVNAILGSYEGADGLKSGFTCGSGYNLVASALRGNRRVIGVVLGSIGRQQRLSQMIKLLDMGFARDVPPQITVAAQLTSMEDEESPPTVLTGAACTKQEEHEGLIAIAEKTRSWGIVLGPYPDRAKAQMALAEARRQVGANGDAARIAAKPYNGAIQYSALIGDLTKSRAESACKTPWGKELYCAAVGPEVLGKVSMANR
jgi:D-alanyl-D-alanine carboxypeptidase